MESSGKRQKKVSVGKQIDRLSGLPDDVLIHILSFLPTKLSVSTSILARRWRFLWAHVPNLDFDSQTHNTERSFADIINRVIMLRKVQSINTFRICCSDNCRVYKLETWLATAVAHNVQTLDLRFDYHVMFPRCIFTCETLVDLRFRGFLGYFSPGDIIRLTSLKKLHLTFDKYWYCDRNLPHLLSGCPVLEELIIDGVVDQYKHKYIISSPSIKRLMLNFQCNTYDSQSCAYRLVITAPSLRYFQLIDCFPGYILCERLSSLIEADVSFNNCKVVGEDYSYTLSVLGKLDVVSNVKSLKLSSGMVFNLRAFGDQNISFDNLTKLELDAHWLILTKFLEIANNLQVIILRKVDTRLKHWMEPKQVPKCLISHLTIIRIDGMGRTKQEFDMVRYLLRNALVLKKMEIFSGPNAIDFEAKFNALQRISSFQRGSVACELAFV